jgi:hypothetical protein
MLRWVELKERLKWAWWVLRGYHPVPPKYKKTIWGSVYPITVPGWQIPPDAEIIATYEIRHSLDSGQEAYRAVAYRLLDAVRWLKEAGIS